MAAEIDRKEKRGGERALINGGNDIDLVDFVPQDPKNKNCGRPKKIIPVTDYSVFQMARAMSPIEDLAILLNTTTKHLKESFSGAIERAHADTRNKMREMLKNMALARGNERVAIWLSKVWCGMAEPVTADPSTVINIQVAEVPTLVNQAISNATPIAIEHMAKDVVVESRPIVASPKAIVSKKKAKRGKNGK